MSRIRAGVAAVAAVAVVVVGWWLLAPPSAVRQHPAAGPVSAPSASSSPSSAAGDDRTPTAPPTKGPPRGTVRVPERYLAAYGAEHVDWDDVLRAGKPLPKPDARCTRRWRASGKDSRLDWSEGRFWCLDGLPGRRWKPQGIAGSGTTEGYRIGGQLAGSRNLVLTSWYSRAPEKGLFAANRPGQSVTRLVVIDLDQRRYGVVELVRPEGQERLSNLNSHGSGLAWAGQYLYSSSKSWLWLYNADDLVRIDGHYVLPAAAQWSAAGRGGLSSISLDRSAGRGHLVAVNYTKSGPSVVQTLALDRHGLLTRGPATAASPLLLSTVFGEEHRSVPSTAASTLPGTHYQGVGRWQRYSFVNSSSARLAADEPRADALVVLQDGAVLERFRMPAGNVESVYVDRRRRTYASLTEGTGQFLFVLPLHQVIERARR